MSQFWIEENDKHVWHRSVARVGHLEYRAACGWELDARGGRVWIVKRGEPGPPSDNRCHSCVGAEEPTAIPIDGGRPTTA